MTTVRNPDLLDSFLSEAWETVGVLEQAGMGFISPDIEVYVHRLRGSAALYGFPQVAELARMLERLLHSSAHYSPEQLERVHQFTGPGR